MSAIDFRTSVARKPDPKGDRVVITLDGKVSPGLARLFVVETVMHSRLTGLLSAFGPVVQFLPYSSTAEGGTWTRENC
jgi:hypothetical protein